MNRIIVHIGAYRGIRVGCVRRVQSNELYELILVNPCGLRQMIRVGYS